MRWRRAGWPHWALIHDGEATVRRKGWQCGRRRRSRAGRAGWRLYADVLDRLRHPLDELLEGACAGVIHMDRALGELFQRCIVDLWATSDSDDIGSSRAGALFDFLRSATPVIRWFTIGEDEDQGFVVPAPLTGREDDIRINGLIEQAKSLP